LGITRSLFDIYLRFGLGEETECRKIQKGFENLRRLKNVIRAIDRTYIFIQNALNKDSEVYFTQKN
ncbi:19363_t:CDS:2, partial [Funneliformis geosporum]